jgi:ABC-type glycerol-3-phosphate transport system permease component
MRRRAAVTTNKINLPRRAHSATPLYRLGGYGWDALRYLVLIGYVLICLYPFVWMVATSLRDSAGVFSSGMSLLVENPQWQNYTEIWVKANVGRAAINTVVITAVCMTAIVLTSSMSAYALARSNFPGRRLVMFALLTTFLIPGEMLIIPTFYVNRALGLIGGARSLLAVILVTTAGAQVFNIYLLLSHFRSVPSELYDAAEIDGSGFFGTYWRVALPLVRPALATIVLLTFMAVWNGYLIPLVYLGQQRGYQTLTIALIQYSKQFQTLYHIMAAGSVIALVPIILMFIFLQRYFIQGLTEGATKG